MERRLAALMATLVLLTAEPALAGVDLAGSGSAATTRQAGPDKVLDQDTKGGHNPHPAPAEGDRHAGGPDAFGYTFTDSNEAGGPSFQWLDISGTGTALTLTDDSSAGPFSLPWPFPFYGTPQTQVWVGSNGLLTFGAGSSSYANQALPDAADPDGLVALFWDDLNPASGGTVYVGSSGGRWVCQFHNVREYGGAGTLRAQVVLEADGTILLHYDALAGGLDLAGETIGIENADGSIGLTASLDGSPAAYPAAGLAIRIQAQAPDASLSGVVRGPDLAPLPGATVRLGDQGTTTAADGSYAFAACWSGPVDLRVHADGHLDHRVEGLLLVPGLNVHDAVLAASGFPGGLAGYWTFDDTGDLTAAAVGNDLALSGSHQAVAGPQPGDGAARIGIGSFYRCFHDIAPNGALPDPDWVNQFTIVMDVRMPQAGVYHCLYQTNWQNLNDGDCFLNPASRMGISQTGYSEYALTEGDWYRLAIRADLGVAYDYYLDGRLLHQGGAQAFEGRFALYPAGGANQVLFFADENGEDAPLDVARLWLFDRALSPAELEGLGGYGHEFDSPVPPHMATYLQTPTPTSVYVCWHSAAAAASVVEYGESEALGQSATGSSHAFDAATVWHWVKLEGLAPNTVYHYRALSDTAVSVVRTFRTPPPAGWRDGHLRFAILSDNQSEPATFRAVLRALRESVEERWGAQLHEELGLVMDTGDIVDSGSTLSQFTTMYFSPASLVSGSVPFMVAIGNHEAEAANFYHYMKYTELAGNGGQGWYAFTLGPARFVVMNSNRQTTAQLQWLQAELDAAVADPDIDWIWAFLHHPGRSETWPDGNTAWVQNQVIPRLAACGKAAQLAYGHTHAFELGAHPESPLRLLCFGGAAGHLDRWGMYGNQTDYAEIHHSADVHGYTLVDLDCANRRMTATAYSLGHEDLPRDNVVLAEWGLDLEAPAPVAPQALWPAGTGAADAWLTASADAAAEDIHGSHFQLILQGGNWSAPLLDLRRDAQNVYGDTGAPQWEPIDLNAGIDLRRLALPAGLLQAGQTAQWRVRRRDTSLRWSAWSAPATFTVSAAGGAADFTLAPAAGEAPLQVQFTDLSGGQPLSWSWELDGDGLPDSAERDPLFTYTQPGVYSPGLTIQTAAGPRSLTRPDAVVVGLAPPLVSARVLGGLLRLDWEAVPGAVDYRVWSAPAVAGPWALEAVVAAGTSWSAPPAGSRRFFQVTARLE